MRLGARCLACVLAVHPAHPAASAASGARPAAPPWLPPVPSPQVAAYREALLARKSVHESMQPPSQEGSYVEQLTSFYSEWLAAKGM